MTSDVVCFYENVPVFNDEQSDQLTVIIRKFPIVWKTDLPTADKDIRESAAKKAAVEFGDLR
jgi:hypothetical protein